MYRILPLPVPAMAPAGMPAGAAPELEPQVAAAASSGPRSPGRALLFHELLVCGAIAGAFFGAARYLAVYHGLDPILWTASGTATGLFFGWMAIRWLGRRYERTWMGARAD